MKSAFMHCLQTHKLYFLTTFSLKIGPIVLFTYLKIILLQYFQFSISAKISSIQTDSLLLIVPIISSSIEKAMDKSNSKIRPTRSDHQERMRPSIPNHWRSVTKQWWALVLLERYLAINTLQRSYLRQHQRLEERSKHLYIPAHKTRPKVQKL